MEKTSSKSPVKAIDIHLQDIERPEYMGKRVRIPLIVAGVGRAYSIPADATAWCASADGDVKPCFNGTRSLPIARVPGFCLASIGKDERKLFAKAKEVAARELKCRHLGFRLSDKRQTVTTVVVYPDYDELACDVATGRTVDEMGREWKRVEAVYLGSIDDKSKEFAAEGLVVAHPSSQEITLVIDKLEAVETAEVLEPVNLSYKDLGDALSKLQRYTAVKGRPEAHLWALMLYATPPYFNFDGELVEGWGRGLFFGDTTTGKGQTIKGLRKLLGKGKYLVAETASRTGLLYGISQVNGTYVLIWGALAQSDGGLIIIDGANNMPKQEWNEFLEAIRSGMLVVNRIVDGQHPCRTRLMLIGNPGYPPAALSTYARAVDALPEMFSEPFIARLDFAVPFSEADVGIEKINCRNERLTPEEQETLARTLGANISFAWRAKPDDIRFDPDAEAEVLRVATELYSQCRDTTVTLVTSDLKKKLARETMSLALLCGRTTATVGDVRCVARHFRELCTRLGLEARRPVEVPTPEIVEDVAAKRSKDGVYDSVVKLLSDGGRYTQAEVGERVGVDPRTVKERLEELRKQGLAISRKQKWQATEALRDAA